MKLADRMKLAAALESIARESGAEVDILPRGTLGDERLTRLHVHWPLLSASFDIGGILEPGILVHFHSAKRDLATGCADFDHVNPYHRRKATSGGDVRSPQFVQWWGRVCADIAAGKVFAQNP